SVCAYYSDSAGYRANSAGHAIFKPCGYRYRQYWPGSTGYRRYCFISHLARFRPTGCYLGAVVLCLLASASERRRWIARGGWLAGGSRTRLIDVTHASPIQSRIATGVAGDYDWRAHLLGLAGRCRRLRD